MAEIGSIRNPFIIVSAKLVVLLLGMAILLHGFVGVLPYHLGPDEPIIRIRADTLASTGHFYDRYSPLGLISLAAQQKLLEVITPPGQLSQSIYYVFGRVGSTLAGMILLALLY